MLCEECCDNEDEGHLQQTNWVLQGPNWNVDRWTIMRACLELLMQLCWMLFHTFGDGELWSRHRLTDKSQLIDYSLHHWEFLENNI